MKKRIRNKAELFVSPGLPRKIRLSCEYVHANSLQFPARGVRCALCHSLLKQEKNCMTTKGCVTCCVPLCSAMSNKFEKTEDSCEYRWHHILDLHSLEPSLIQKMPIKRKISETVASVACAVYALLSLSQRPRRKRRR